MSIVLSHPIQGYVPRIIANVRAAPSGGIKNQAVKKGMDAKLNKGG
jgi:hypothetical protein